MMKAWTAKFLHKVILLLGALALTACTQPLRGTGDLALIIERADSSIKIVETTNRRELMGISDLGDLSHASAVYSRDARYAFIFGRDGGLTKIDMLTGKMVKRVMQSGNAIGGAISQDGRLIAVSNYKPGGVRIFNSETLELVADIPTQSKVVGLVDAPDQRFIFSLYDLGEIWIADMTDVGKPAITTFEDVGDLPYDGLITPDGRFYMAGLFGEDGIAMLDLWQLDKGVQRVLDGYGRGEEKLPVYKMPHLEGWASAGDVMVLPAVGRYEILLVNKTTWREVDRIKVHGQPVFAIARPDGRQVWVNFAHPRNDTIQVIDLPSRKIIKTFKPGKAVLHMEFNPRGEEVWMSVRDEDRVDIYNTRTLEKISDLPALKPSGIFMTYRAHHIGL